VATKIGLIMRCSEPGGASRLESWRPVRRAAELGSFGDIRIMKICDYCGRENEDEAVRCHECGTQEFKTPAAEPGASALPNAPTETSAPGWEFRELTPQEMQMDLVTLIGCRTLPEADMIVSELRGAGISAFIPDEFLSQAVLWNLNTYGYVRVQVSPKDYASAKEFLLAPPGNAEPGASPNGGPTTSQGNAEAQGEPPSVS
jgi:ribosomal protein L40E